LAILVVEDEPDLTDLLTYILRRAGYSVLVAFDGESALRMWQEKSPELVLLDIGLPRTDGWEVCRTIRSQSATPIVILSGADAEEDVVRGLDLGAEDYVSKPFSPKLLQARIKAVLRRAQMDKPASDRKPVLTVGDVSLDSLWRTLSREGKSVRLTQLEYRVLQELAIRPGQVIPHDELIQRVWGYSGEGKSDLVKGHIRNIRSKLSELGSRTSVKVIPGVGYLLTMDEAI
jgi:DNA-binding response OmpR family regulator